MRYRKLDADGDMTFGNQQLNFYRDVPEAVAQAVLTRLRLWAGEWYLNIDSGTPYQNGILGKHSKQEADIVIRDTILNTIGVAQINTYSSSIDADTRRYSFAANITTIYGVTTVESAL